MKTGLKVSIVSTLVLTNWLACNKKKNEDEQVSTGIAFVNSVKIKLTADSLEVLEDSSSTTNLTGDYPFREDLADYCSMQVKKGTYTLTPVSGSTGGVTINSKENSTDNSNFLNAFKVDALAGKTQGHVSISPIQSKRNSTVSLKAVDPADVEYNEDQTVMKITLTCIAKNG